MRIDSLMHSSPARSSLVTLITAVGLTISPMAEAQVGAETADSGAKGTVGGALLGAELVMSVEAAFKVKPWWGYAIGGGLGATGGAVGGFFVDDLGNPGASMGMLVAGLVFAVPTTIAVLNATTYRVDQNPTIDDELALEGYPGVRVQQPTVRALPATFVGLDDQGFRLGVPAVRVNEVYSMRQRLIYGLPSETEVTFPVVGVTF